MRIERFTSESYEKRQIEDFIELHNRIYPKNQRTQNAKELRLLLIGDHALSTTWETHAFLLYDEEKALARLLLTFYPGDKTAYLGFIEGVDNHALNSLMEEAETFANLKGTSKIIAPVDASFWISYRHVLSRNREIPWTAEPWQEERYTEVYENRNYSIAERYFSYSYKDSYIKSPEENKKIKKRYLDAIQEGYVFRNPKKGEFTSLLEDIYNLLMPLYADFPIYKKINYEAFKIMFGDMGKFLNRKAVELAFHNGKLVGFLLTIPDYGNLIYRKMTPLTIMRILFRKRFARHYLQLYMAVAKGHEGIGAALAHVQYSKAKISKIHASACLIHEGKATAIYGKKFVDDVTEYVLFQKFLDQKYLDHASTLETE